MWRKKRKKRPVDTLKTINVKKRRCPDRRCNEGRKEKKKGDRKVHGTWIAMDSRISWQVAATSKRKTIFFSDRRESFALIRKKKGGQEYELTGSIIVFLL